MTDQVVLKEAKQKDVDVLSQLSTNGLRLAHLLESDIIQPKSMVIDSIGVAALQNDADLMFSCFQKVRAERMLKRIDS